MCIEVRRDIRVKERYTSTKRHLSKETSVQIGSKETIVIWLNCSS